MLYGDPTWLDDILEAIVAKIASGTGLPKDCVFDSLAEDASHLSFPPADRFITLRPGRFPVGRPGVTGGGRALTGFEGPIRVALFVRLGEDQEFRDTRILRDKSRGAFKLLLKLIDTMQLFAPANKDGKGMLREPMRIEDFDFTPRRIGQTSWVVVPTVWEIKFTAPLST
jgi:hypothetical protein